MVSQSDLLLESFMELGEGLAKRGEAFPCMSRAIMRVLGDCYFSVSLLEPDTVLRRVYSSMPALYPCGGLKSMVGTGWADAIVLERRHLFSPDSEALHHAFQDADAIVEHGFGCAINLCLALNGEVLGSANLLAPEGAFSPHSFSIAKAFAAPLALTTALESQSYLNR